MNKKLSRPMLIGINIIGFLVFIAVGIYTTEVTKLPAWSLIFPFLVMYSYILEKISILDPYINKRNTFHKISTMPIKDRLIFWISTFAISIIYILEGFYLKSENTFKVLLLIIANSLLWIGIQWICSVNLRKVIFKRE